MPSQHEGLEGQVFPLAALLGLLVGSLEVLVLREQWRHVGGDGPETGRNACLTCRRSRGHRGCRSVRVEARRRQGGGRRLPWGYFPLHSPHPVDKRDMAFCFPPTRKSHGFVKLASTSGILLCSYVTRPTDWYAGCVIVSLPARKGAAEAFHGLARIDVVDQRTLLQGAAMAALTVSTETSVPSAAISNAVEMRLHERPSSLARCSMCR